MGTQKSKNTKFNFFIIVNYALSILTMVLVLILTGRMMRNDYERVSLFLGLSILSEVVFQIIVLLFLKKAKKDRLRILLVSLIFTAAAVVAFISANNNVLFYISTFLLIFGMACNQLLLIFQ